MKYIATSTIALLALLGAPSLQAKDKEHKDHSGHAHAAAEGHSGHMLKGYMKVSAALAADDLAAAKDAADDMVEHDAKSALAKPAAAIVKSADIKTARKHFIDLSHAAIKMAGKEKGYFVMTCPMVKNGDWLQTNAKVKNPYMGKKMPSCGTQKSATGGDAHSGHKH